jgi:hypothetical protein
MITASGEPAVAMRFAMSAGVTVLASRDDFCEWAEKDEMAESIEEVRGMPRRGPPLSAMADATAGLRTGAEADVDMADGGVLERADSSASLRCWPGEGVLDMAAVVAAVESNL